MGLGTPSEPRWTGRPPKNVIDQPEAETTNAGNSSERREDRKDEYGERVVSIMMEILFNTTTKTTIAF